jgi:hypothetical protein
MIELFPVILGIIFGVLIGRVRARRSRAVLSVAAVFVSGTAATMLSGEFVVSWIYLLLDLGEAALGLALGFVIVHLLQRARILGRKSSSLS